MSVIVRSALLTLCAELEDASVQSGPLFQHAARLDGRRSEHLQGSKSRCAGCFSDGLSSTLRSVSDLQAVATSMSVAIVFQA